MKKIWSAIIGYLLYKFYVRKLSINNLTGKSIAIVGPADSALGTGLGAVIDGYDVVVRMNKAPYQLAQGLHKHDIGSKIDILFHSFLENDKTGGGKIDFELYDKLGVEYLANPIPSTFGKRKIFNFYKKYMLPRKTYYVEKYPYQNNIRNFGNYRPSTGFAALNFLLHADFKTLYITGFTFFKTSYFEGYRDHLRDKKSNDAHLKAENNHKPEIEFVEFVKLLNRFKGKSITTDSKLSEILLHEAGVNITFSV